MRVIAGEAKGHRLLTPKGSHVRPTLDRVRESLFSILGPYLEDAQFLDLFAGTGANGIEALSRGAAMCTFVDADPRSLQLVRRNLETTRLLQSAELWRLILPRGLRKLAEKRVGYDIIFADPPFSFLEYGSLLRHIRETELLAPEGLIVVEHAERTPPPEDTGGFTHTRLERYGETALSFFS